MPRLFTEDLKHVLDHTRPLWEELRGQNLFITGGTGFFGHWLLESFAFINDQLNLEAKVLVLSRHPEVFADSASHLANHPAIRFVKGDVCDFDFPDGEFRYVIHAATDVSAKLNEEDPQKVFNIIVYGTRHTIDFACSHGTQKFLLTSSGAVYGKQPPEVSQFPEDYTGAPNPMNPSSDYGEGKRAAEMMCTLAAKDNILEMKIARCFGFVGPYLPLDAHFAIGNFIRDAMRGDPIVIKGDGTSQRSYLYSADLTIWLWTILFRGKTAEPYNVGSEIPISITDLAKKIARINNNQPFPLIVFQGNEHMNSGSYIPSINKARSELNLQQWIDLEQSIQRTIAWYSNNTHVL